MHSKDNIDFRKSADSRNFLFPFLGNGVVTTGAPRMTARYPLHTEQGAFADAPLIDSFDRVLRARRCVTAVSAKHRR